ncbi:MAG: sn-glycerol-1-phosphate dehydrogenase [Candidatus Latescibacteria bacterium]|nr:sn-glycerol-1-phosphate dehydrogenase [Candidatus Latescibacterota bacterium]
MPEKSMTIDSWLHTRFTCPACGNVHTIPTEVVVIEEGALKKVPSVLKRIGLNGKGLLVADKLTFQAAGREVERVLKQNDVGIDVLLLDDPVKADERALKHVAERITLEHRFLLAVGSGTINDIVKRTGFEAGLPYLVCPTAPSMNGYTSSVAAMTINGLKQTLEAHPARAVIADVEVVAQAPIAMIRAGLGDLLSKSVSLADWKLAHRIRGGFYCPLPSEMVASITQKCSEHAAGIGRGERTAIRELMEGLILSGFSMVVAGSSSPASGGEHLISHYWDMAAEEDGRPHALHGAQVGVATLVTAKLYEILSQWTPDRIDVDALVAAHEPWDAVDARLRSEHGGNYVAVRKEAKASYLSGEVLRGELTKIKQEWDEIWSDLSGVLRPFSEIKTVLKKAGAPIQVADLGLDHTALRAAFLGAKDIRARYTVLDFAHELGLLIPLADRVIEESGV